MHSVFWISSVWAYRFEEHQDTEGSTKANKIIAYLIQWKQKKKAYMFQE